MISHRLRGLYAITDAASRTSAEQFSLCEAVLQGGAKVLQYRDKTSDTQQCEENAARLATLCQHYGAAFIINDDVDLAIQVGADGVHLGRDDTDILAARKRLGSGYLIGISCYNTLERAQEAASAGADYIAFGSFFSSPTKPHAVRAQPRILTEARSRFSIPLVAIGGITPENGASLIQAGADMLAVISGLFAQRDPRAAATRYARLFASD